MKYLDKFNFFRIDEKMGIAEPTLFYVPYLTNFTMPILEDFVERTKDIPAKKVKEEKISHKIGYRKFKAFISDYIEYSYFPVVEILLDITMSKDPIDELTAPRSFKRGDIRKKNMPFGIGGSAFPFAKGNEKGGTRMKPPIRTSANNHGISVHLELIFYYSDFYKETPEKPIWSWKDLRIQVESTYTHELNHLYEQYRMKLYKVQKFNLTKTFSALENKYKRPKQVFKYWQKNFGELIYLTEPHEIRAYVQEGKSYVDRMSLSKLKETYYFKTIEKMKNFNYKDFLEDFMKNAKSYNPDYDESLIDIFINDYKKLYRETEKHNVEKEKQKPAKYSPDYIDSLSNEEFMELWQNEIREAGDKIYRKVLKLYSYNN